MGISIESFGEGTTIPVPLADGGTGASLVATPGAIVYGTSAAMAFSNVGTSGQILVSGGTGAPTWISVVPVANGGTGTSTTFTQGSVVFAGASGVYSQDNANFFYDASQVRFGLGTNSPSATLDVHSGIQTAIQANYTGAQGATGGASVAVQADPGAALLSGSRLGFFGFAGAVNASHTLVNGAAIQGYTTENWSSTARGTQLVFSVTPNATTGVQTGMTLGQDKSLAVVGALSAASASFGTPLPLSSGGTNANLTAVNGGVAYSDASKLQVTVAGTSGQYLKSTGAGAPTWQSFKPPTVQRFTAAGSGTYTTPAGVLYLKVTIVGGGSGGAGSSTSAASNGGSSSAGSPSYFNSSGYAQAGGGGVADQFGGGAGGTNTVSGPTVLFNSPGNYGQTQLPNVSANNSTGMSGGAGYFGGAATSSNSNGSGGAGSANTGAGGAGAGGPSSGFGGSGGGSGGVLQVLITSPASSYSYSVGGGSSGGSAGTSGNAGGAGGSGIIVVEEYYQ